jgi:cytochrome c biogenesis protein CcmG/thiol:disulfide interchange protein DsbE
MRAPDRRTSVAIVALVVVVLVALVINRATGTKQAGLPSSPQRAALVAAAHLTDCPVPTGGGKVAGGLPSLTLPCLGAGPKVNLAKLRGPLVVNIWAGPCPPCKAEAPMIQRFYAAAAGQVGVLGVVDAAYPDTADDALDAARGLGLRYPSVFDAHGDLVDRVRTVGIPVSLLVAADGTVAYTKIGQLTTAAQLAALVKQYLGVSVET